MCITSLYVPVSKIPSSKSHMLVTAFVQFVDAFLFDSKLWDYKCTVGGEISQYSAWWSRGSTESTLQIALGKLFHTASQYLLTPIPDNRSSVINATPNRTSNIVSPFKQSCQHCMALSDSGNIHITDCHCCALWRPYWSNWDLSLWIKLSYKIQTIIYWSQMPDATMFLLQHSWLHTFVDAGHGQFLTEMRQLRTIILTTSSALLSTVQW